MSVLDVDGILAGRHLELHVVAESPLYSNKYISISIYVEASLEDVAKSRRFPSRFGVGFVTVITV